MTITSVLTYFIVFMLGVIASNQTQIVKNMRTIRLNSATMRANSAMQRFGMPLGYQSDRTADDLEKILTLWISGREGVNPEALTLTVMLPRTVTRDELRAIIQSMRTPHGMLGYYPDRLPASIESR